MRFGQFYYSYDGDFEIHKLLWQDEISDFCNLRLGFVFDTYKEKGIKIIEAELCPDHVNILI